MTLFSKGCVRKINNNTIVLQSHKGQETTTEVESQTNFSQFFI